MDGLRAAVRYIRALPRHKQRHVELDSEKDGDDLRWCVTFTSTARLQVLYAAQQSPYWGSPSLSIDGTHSPCQLSNVIALTSMVKDMGGSCTLVGIALASAESAWAVNKFKQHLQSLVRKNVAKPGLPFTLRGMYTTHDGGLPLQKAVFCLATLRSRLLLHGSAVRGLGLIAVTSRRRGARRERSEFFSSLRN